MCKKVSGVKNIRVGLKENSEGLTLTHKIESGFAEKSFGIEVAKRAGLPKEVLNLASLAIQNPEIQAKVETKPISQVNLFEEKPNPKLEAMANSYRQIKQDFEAININSLTPLQALNILANLKDKY